MNIDLVFPALPPALDGIGDHTARLATALSAHHTVRIWTAEPNPTPLPGVDIRTGVHFDSRSGLQTLARDIAATPPDAVVLQYNPFSYGRWGLNLTLPGLLPSLRRHAPETRLAVMVHEPFVPVESLRFAVFTTWQRWQLWQLGRAADTLFFSIAPWVGRFGAWFPNTPCHLLPVGSNIPVAPAARTRMRAQLGFDDGTTVLGFFGSAHESRDLALLRRALNERVIVQKSTVLLYVGHAGAALRAALPNIRVQDAGALPPEAVSQHLAAMDLYLAPFRDGVSTRRGSFMVGLQHGLPTLTTLGPDTDASLRSATGTAFAAVEQGDAEAFASQMHRLLQRAELRDELGRSGSALYRETYDWPLLAPQLIHGLFAPASVPAQPPVPAAPAS